MFDDEDILRVFHESDKPFLGTQEVADGVGFRSKQGAHQRLEELVEKDQLRRRVVGGVSIWYLPARVVESSG